MSADTELTLDELERRSGVSRRTIRYYTTRGLLPAPTKSGRVAVYDRGHLARLELVRELQGHGLTLAAIEAYLERVPDGADPETIGLHRTLLSPWSAPSEVLRRADLEERAGRALSADDLEVLIALGVVADAGRGRYEVSTSLVSLGMTYLDLGLPASTAQAAHTIIERHGRALAEELTDLFREQVWPSYRTSQASPEELAQTVARFKPLTISALVAAYEAAVDETKRDVVVRRSGAEA